VGAAGGSLEGGKPPWEAVVRETREENGLEVEVRALVGMYAKRQEADLVFVSVAPSSAARCASRTSVIGSAFSLRIGFRTALRSDTTSGFATG
jgi:8-oxo-dGTP pyrophosphatase MutT (NUDIX family)